MKTKSSQSSTPTAKTPKLNKPTLRDLTAKQAGGIKGGALKKRIRG